MAHPHKSVCYLAWDRRSPNYLYSLFERSVRSDLPRAVGTQFQGLREMPSSAVARTAGPLCNLWTKDERLYSSPSERDRREKGWKPIVMTFLASCTRRA